jgi:hypothetical protein
LTGVDNFSGNFREISALIKLSNNKAIFIDSFCQHAAKAVGIEPTVCWITNNPNQWGYSNHRHVFPNHDMNQIYSKELPDGYFLPYDFAGSKLYDYPFDSPDVFNIGEIVEPYV